MDGKKLDDKIFCGRRSFRKILGGASGYSSGVFVGEVNAMKLLLLRAFVLSLVITITVSAQTTDYTKFVNPFIGTKDTGHTFPGATAPFGLVQPSPDTGDNGWAYTSGYQFADKEIFGFSNTHLSGVGVPDLGDILLQPFTGEAVRENYKSGLYSNGNEPGHHIAYLYKFTNEGWKTDELVREITTRFYSNKPDGITDNNDCGQMSAWYILSSIGLYPVKPSSGEYVLGAPQIASAKLDLANGKFLQIEAKNLSEANKYVKEVYLNGKRFEKISISHAEIVKGGKLTFVMTDKID